MPAASTSPPRRSLQAKELLQKPYVYRFHKMLEQFSVDTQALYSELQFDPTAMADPNTSIPMSEYLLLLERAAALSGNQYLSISMALEERNQNFGVLGYMLRNATDFGQALQLLNRYIGLVSPGSCISLHYIDENCILTYDAGDFPPDLCRQDVEGTLAQFILMIQTLLEDDEWHPQSIYFKHTATEPMSNFPLSGELHFNHHFNGVSFPAELLKQRNRDFDPELLAILEAQVQAADAQPADQESSLDQVSVVIYAAIGNGPISSEKIATQAGMSRSSLYRHLRQRGTRFRELREHIVFGIARDKLLTSAISITELALYLGYSEASAFDRAFKRTTGLTPLQYRKQNLPG
jgi:AraC-like DNA-binding protein